MPDPRYTNGVFTNTAAINRQHKIDRKKAYADSHPSSYGWEFDYWNEKYDMPVYKQGGFKIMIYQGIWIVQHPNTDEGFPMLGTIQEITRELF